MYKIVMPQLSDSMEEGKLIAWKVQEGAYVKSGDVIAEVESDKAVMEVQTFHDGRVAKLLIQEGESAPVGSVIALIAEEGEAIEDIEEPVKASFEQKQEKSQQVKEEEKQQQASVDQHSTPRKIVTHDIPHTKELSPKARIKAASYGLDIQRLTQTLAKSYIHADDIDAYLLEHYFTPKAQKLLQQYKLDLSSFTLDHKIDAQEVRNYIQEHAIALPKELSSMQKAIIATVENAAKKPVFHVYEHIDASLLQDAKSYSVTVWFIKLVAMVMMRHDAFRSSLKDEMLFVAADASLSVAVANGDELYMPVVKAANRRSLAEISKAIAAFKEKARTKSFSAADMQGSSFGLSNLGMLGVERFDAMINKEDTGIIAIGTLRDGKIAVTLTLDHRLINGYEAGLFIQELKEAFLEPKNFKE